MVLDDKPTPQRNNLYKEQFEVLSFNTTEYDDMRDLLRTEVFPTLPSMGHFLDIGAGRGNYARPFSQEFVHTTVVEPNEVFFNEILDWARENDAPIDGFNCNWQVADFDEEVDLALMSHMLYYVHKDVRLNLIDKAYECVKPGGSLIISLNSLNCDIRKVYYEFYPDDLRDDMPYGEQIAEMLRDAGYPNVQERPMPAVMTLPTLDDMHLLIDFLLLRKIPFDSEEIQEQRQKFIEDNFTHDGELVMAVESQVVLVQKPW